MSIADFPLLSRSGPASNNYSEAYNLPASQVWDGNDGAWTTFVIRVGTPPQFFRIIPATSGQETWVPIPSNCSEGVAWCGNARGVEPFNSGTSGPASGSPTGVTLGSLDAGKTCTANKSPFCGDCTSVNGKCSDGPCIGRTCCGDPPGACNSGGCNGVSGICTGAYIGCPCPGPDYNADNGSTTGTASATSPILAQGFLSNMTSTWTDQGDHVIGAKGTLNVTVQGEWGLDTVGLGSDPSSSLTLNSSIVTGVPTEPFFLGHLGLIPSKTTGPDGNTASLMQQLADQAKIPSMSYGYTAGALYKTKQGSLTFGGYDLSLFTPNHVSFPISDNGHLLLPIQSITGQMTLQPKNQTLLPNNITANIDTTLAHMWLPLDACRAFENAFGLIWDDSNRYYLVNDTTHQQLLNNNPIVTFTLGSANQTLDISLPYGAFDLQASSPVYPNGTNYFPLRRASDPSQYTIGRAFFQESYIIVDYESANFSISQTVSKVPQSSNIVTINHHNHPIPSSTAAASTLNEGLSGGALAGIVVGSVVGAIIIAGALLFFYFRRRRASNRDLNECPRPEMCQQKGCKDHDTSSSDGGTSVIYEKGEPWPVASPDFHGHSSTPGDTLIGSTRSHGTYPTELEDATSPIGRSGTNQSRMGMNRSGSSLSKPLPRTPQELAGNDPVDELMDRQRGSKGEMSTTDRIRLQIAQANMERQDSNGSSITVRSGQRSLNDAVGSPRRVKHIYEMMG